MMIKTDVTNIKGFLNSNALDSVIPELSAAHELLEAGNGPGGEFLGWLKLPIRYDKAEFARIKTAAAKIISDSEVLLVIGIGGSYLGARAVVEFLRSPNYNLKKKNTPDILFAGNNLSPAYYNEIIELIGERDFSINVISKSGTTTEPAIAFRVFKRLLEKKYGKDGAKNRIYATTDKARGALKSLSDTEGYESFVIPDDVGGRFSVLTPVGLLPIACSGIDIDALMAGAAGAMEDLSERSMQNSAWQYAAARNLLLRRGKTTEILACYEPSFRFMAEWWKQLYGESEGKGLSGIFPASIDLTADLHSLGQYVQDGIRNIFETVVKIEAPTGSLVIEPDEHDLDGLNFISGRDLHFVNEQAFRGTLIAHVDGGVPNIVLTMPAQDEKSLGELIYFFELACGLSGYVLGVNPFDQPGVEAYKKNMFALLGKPGYEELAAKLNAGK